MKCHLIFEDNKKVPLSQLLLGYIPKEFGCELHFSDGSAKLGDKICKILDKDLSNDCIILGFLDVVPDNDETMQQYKSDCDEFRDCSNVYIIPIICAEYMVLSYLCDIEFNWANKDASNLLNYIIKVKDWRTPDKLGIMPKSKKITSLETLYKYVLSIDSYNKYDRCLINVNRESRPLYGEFYRSACICDDCTRCSLDRESKALGIFSKYPTPFINLTSSDKKLLDIFDVDLRCSIGFIYMYIRIILF